MNDNPEHRPQATQGQGFSLASILLLTAVVAVFFAAVATGMKSEERADEELVIACAVGGLIVGGLVGVGIGLTQIRRLRGVALGVCAGTTSGTMAGVLLAMPRGLPAIVVGSLVLVLFAGVVRFFSRGSTPSQWH